jgi:hypothetical protein
LSLKKFRLERKRKNDERDPTALNWPQTFLNSKETKKEKDKEKRILHEGKKKNLYQKVTGLQVHRHLLWRV